VCGWMRLRVPVCGSVCQIRAKVWRRGLDQLLVVPRPRSFLDAALGFVLLAGYALGVDAQQDVNAVSCPVGDLRGGHSGVQPGRNGGVPQVVGATGEQGCRFLAAEGRGASLVEDLEVGPVIEDAAARRGTPPPLPAGPEPTFALYLLARQPPRVPWEARWIRWPDFWLPSDRVEIACTGGHGRTGTALACLAVLDGLPGRQAVAYVRQQYAVQAVETPWQRRYVARFR